jgi:phage shock protein E
VKHTLLIALSLSLLASVSRAADPPATRPSTQPSGVHNVGVDDFAKLAADTKNVILDVRTPREFAAGHLPGAVNVNWTDKTFAEKIASLDKSKTYLVHCKMGGRSAKACNRLEQENFLNIYNLKGGIDAWTEAGKETVKE